MRDTILYDRLGLKPECNDSEIKKAYFKLSKKWHPDKNKSEEATKRFQEISEAYEILKDKEKREMYHQVGIDILRNGGQEEGGIDPSDFFNNFFSGFDGFRNKNKKKDDREHINERLYISLEDIYNGNKVDISFNRKIFCEECDGTGNKDKKLHDCDKCKGSGQEVKVVRMGPMIQQHVQTCHKCKGTGKGGGNSEKCEKCFGKNHHVKKETISLPIRQDMADGMKMKIDGKGNKYKNGTTSLILHITEKPHSLFKRQGQNLIMELEIELIESIIGFEREFKFLDGKKYKVKFNEGKTINDGDLKIIKNMGMRNGSNGLGDLIVKFNVKRKNIKDFSQSEKELLAKTFDYKMKKINNNNEVSLKDFNNSRQQRGMNDDSDEERPQCAQQ